VWRDEALPQQLLNPNYRERVKIYGASDSISSLADRDKYVRMHEIEERIRRSLEEREQRGELGVVRKPSSATLVAEAPDPYFVAVVSATAGVATKEIAALVVDTIKAVLKHRRKTDDEDLRDPDGYL
jgi:hypothetical protein